MRGGGSRKKEEEESGRLMSIPPRESVEVCVPGNLNSEKRRKENG